LPSRPLDEQAVACLDPDTGALGLTPIVATGALALEDTGPATLLARPHAVVAADARCALPLEVSIQVALRSGRAVPPSTGPPSSAAEPAPRITEELALIVRRRGVERLASEPVRPSSPARHPAEGEELLVAIELATAAAPPPPIDPLGRAPSPEATRDRRSVPDATEHANLRRELIALAPLPLKENESLAWVVPSPFSSDRAEDGRSIAIALELSRAPAEHAPGAAAHARSLDTIERSLVAERLRASEEPREESRPSRPHFVDREPIDLEPVVAELARVPTSRAALQLLANRTGTTLGQEVALAAPDSVIVAAGRAMLAAFARHEALTHTAAEIGGTTGGAVPRWRPLSLELDLAVLETLLRYARRPPSRAILERHYGIALDDDLADAGTPLLPLASAALDRATFDRLVLARNLLGLDDARPSVRLRAARWLVALRPGLEGYDPFGPIGERHAAADRLWAVLVPPRGAS
jgi:hypothetical protein